MKKIFTCACYITGTKHFPCRQGAHRLGQMNFVISKVVATPYILPVSCPIYYCFSIKVGNAYLEIEENCPFDPV
ncbi:hypothetical protein KsCSTR_13090 [Candidatus Kuenenia stuttgartiensis]|uniref:Uncharacterized protein n=1 Tax=Kuenenia stuttgartiensis TaxID=174633 RepID=Q1Q0Y4_KUEST|nr:hypothetical protein KsCSTR_13090 [Candidatus Kuenenia stuttgartiensis]CAJ73655.1 unknown protein [Candidatus Kuenenia stuttgartiensis]